MNERIRVMVEGRQLEQRAAPDAEVAGLWNKAVRTRRSAAVPALDADAAFTLGYQASLQAATALVRAAGFRVRGEGHHHHTFAALAALALPVSDAARDLNVVRQQRHGAVYGWRSNVLPGDAQLLRDASETLFTEGLRWLASARPTIEGDLEGG